MSGRYAGVLLHPTSLPSPYGMGEIGKHCLPFLDWLERAGQSYWQMLPLGPTDRSGSPYASPSAFARNPLLIGLDDLVDDGFLRQAELPAPFGDPERLDHLVARQLRWGALLTAASRVSNQDIEHYRKTHPWVDSWASYATIAETHGGDWLSWPKPLRERTDLAEVQDSPSWRRHIGLQWLFDLQWQRLRTAAFQRGVSLIGDVPFFVSLDSADAWSRPDLFRLGKNKRPAFVSGVPPDAFSADGQLWGHPLYAEEAHVKEGFAWWIQRIQANLDLVDAVRLDHFRGIAAYWEVKAGSKHARDGRWIPGPGRPLLDALGEAIGKLPFIAEDLGIITADVEALRDDYDLPGMAILQFGFGHPGHTQSPHLPHNHRRHQVVYSGTHDNPTSWGWYLEADERTRDHVRRYLLVPGNDIAGDLVRAAYRSTANTAILPLQDLLSLGPSARMNIPGQIDGNWSWRVRPDQLQPAIAAQWAEQAKLTGRHSAQVRRGV